MKNQNQYPPTHNMAAPRCHNKGQSDGVTELGVEYENIITAVAMTNSTKPYIVRR
jgi:hypothetical protein